MLLKTTLFRTYEAIPGPEDTDLKESWLYWNILKSSFTHV